MISSFSRAQAKEEQSKGGGAAAGYLPLITSLDGWARIY
jgi:hypothetical protein